LFKNKSLFKTKFDSHNLILKRQLFLGIYQVKEQQLIWWRVVKKYCSSMF